MSCNPWTLEKAREMLNAWVEANAAVATGQSYKIGTRSLTRASLPEIMGQIKFWRAEVCRLEAGRPAGIRTYRIVPRDL